MAYREVEMWEVLEVLRRVHRGQPQRAIQRVTGHGRTTIRRYVRTARALGWTKDQEPGEKLAAKGADRGLQLSKVHQLLAQQGVEVPYSSLHRFAVKRCGFADSRRVTVRVAEVAPGELAEVDFGRLGLVPDPESGGRRVAHALIVTLVHSRHQYVHISFSQKLGDLIEGLEDAWEFFGGVVTRVVIDNLKSAVTKADRYDPVFQRTFAEYARYRGFVIDAALPGHATGKPHVERGVQYLRENFFRGETWIDREHVQREAIRWCLTVAGQRVHGTTRQRLLAVFENHEKPALQPLERKRFDLPQWAQCKVHHDHHISLGKALYSVPTRHVGKTLWVRSDRALVRIYGEGELIKTHERQPEGGRSTDYRDYPEELAPYAMRDPDRMIREARRQGEHVGQFMGKLLAGPYPWTKLRQAQKLLRLANKYGRKRLEVACRRALAFDLLNVRRVEATVKHDLDRIPDSSPREPRGQLVRLSSRFLRPPESFTHHPKQKEKSDGDHPIPQDCAQTPEALRPPADAARPHRLRPEDEAQ
jgi:hypothetical protein